MTVPADFVKRVCMRGGLCKYFLTFLNKFLNKYIYFSNDAIIILYNIFYDVYYGLYIYIYIYIYIVRFLLIISPVSSDNFEEEVFS